MGGIPGYKGGFYPPWEHALVYIPGWCIPRWCTSLYTQVVYPYLPVLPGWYIPGFTSRVVYTRVYLSGVYKEA